MHSIRTKLTAITIISLLVSLLSIGSLGIFAVKTQGDRDAAQFMSLICDNCRKTLNAYLNSVEQSVDMVTRYVSETLNIEDLTSGGVIGASGEGSVFPNGDEISVRQMEFDAHLFDHIEMVRTVFRSVANHTNGVIAYYYRINPEISREMEGFLFSKIRTASFSELPLTNPLLYSPDDVEHVGWYYIPLQRGRPSWIGPYYNDNLGIEMLSYVTPIYKAGTFIGVVGMDIDYSTLVSQISELRILDSGYALLTDEYGTVVYHPEIPKGENIADTEPPLAAAVQRFAEKNSGSHPIRYSYHGVKKQMYFNTLSNNMRLVVVAPESEIRASTLNLIYRITLAGFAIVILFSALMVATTTHLTEPLRRLTSASRHLAEGDYEVNLNYRGNDEVGILTGAFEQLVEHLRVYINDLNSRAYQDALTGVKNKGAYNVSARMLNDAVKLSRIGAKPEFAIVMLDCNNLKKINDQYGHEKGDIYLKTACDLICRVFTHSPVFRMGGDEFAVILQHDDYDDRKDLMTRFDVYTEQINLDATEPWEEVHIAKGMAVYDPQKDESVESVLQRADENMYTDKKRSKARRFA